MLKLYYFLAHNIYIKQHMRWRFKVKLHNFTLTPDRQRELQSSVLAVHCNSFAYSYSFLLFCIQILR